jgi:hypothetical protein
VFGTWSSNPRRKLRAKGMSYETFPNYLTVYLTYSRAIERHLPCQILPATLATTPVNSEVGGAPAIECFARKITLIVI